MGLGFNEIKKDIREKNKRRSEGKFNCIPFYEDFPRFSKIIPGIIKGCLYLITAGAGVGKSKFTRTMFIRVPYDFVKRHPDCGIKLKIMYFTFEESKEEVIQTMICNKLYELHGIELSPSDLDAFGEKELDEDTLKKIDELTEYFKGLDECLEVIDGIDNPTGIYKHCREYSRANGVHYYYHKDNKNEITHDEYDKLSAKDKNNFWYSRYKANDEDEYVIIIADHISLLKPEKGADGSIMGHHDTLTKWSSDYCRKQMTRHWRYVVANVQQQMGSGESVEHFKAGKLEPSLDKLADNKYTQRDALVVIGLFSPYRHLISKHGGGYDIELLKDSYLSAKVLKNRKGKTGSSLPLYFDGLTETFKEIPKLDDTEKLKRFYAFVKQIQTTRK